MAWTKEEVASAIYLRENGMVMTKIANALGKSKNAVIGKLYRIGTADVKGLSDSSMDERLPPNNITDGCRYVYGEVGIAWHWCGAQIERGSYCADHNRITYRVINGKDIES